MASQHQAKAKRANNNGADSKHEYRSWRLGIVASWRQSAASGMAA